jgi:hypothetical protein
MNGTTIARRTAYAIISGFLLAGACGRKGDYDFEQRTREAWPESINLIGMMDGEVFSSKKGNCDFDPVKVLTSFIQSNVVCTPFQSDVYYINTNKCLWMTNSLSSDPAIVKKVVSRINPSRVMYVGVTFGCKKVSSTNLFEGGLVPVLLPATNSLAERACSGLY